MRIQFKQYGTGNDNRPIKQVYRLRNASDAVEMATGLATGRVATDATFEATINKRKTKVLIDSGASCNVMAQGTFKQLGGGKSSTVLHTSLSFGSSNPSTIGGRI